MPCPQQVVALGSEPRGQAGAYSGSTLGNGDSIASSHPFLVAAPSPISANKTVPLHLAPKSVPFMGRNVTQIPSYTKAIQEVFKSYSECLVQGLKCQVYVESKDPGGNKDSVLKLCILLEIGKMEKLC